MKIRFWLSVVALCVVTASPRAVASSPEEREEQTSYEREIGAVVRNKIYYKPGTFEVSFTGGTMPYDSVVTNYLIGGRATWHLSDHFGWEIVDAQFGFPSVGTFAQNLLKVHTHINNLQNNQMKMWIGSSLLMSPFYSKIRMFGRWVIYFDIYVSVGLGFAKTETLRLASAGGSTDPTVTLERSGFDPGFSVGAGFKIFLTNGIGMLLELRDYVVYTEEYSSKRLRSNYTVFGGLTFFLPSFEGR